MSDSQSVPLPAPIQTVLCAVDFSETAEIALEHATDWAKRHGARLVLAHVIEPLPIGPYPIPMAPDSEVAIRKIASQRVEKIGAELRETGLVVEVRVDSGNPGAVLAAVADDEEVDLVVIGTRGLTGFQHLLLGSTAEYLVHRCTRPVLTVHPGDRRSGGAPRLVVVPTDQSSETTASADALASLFVESALREGEGRPNVLLTFADRTPPYLEPFRHDTLLRMGQRDVVREEIEGRMAPMIDRLRKSGFEVEPAVLDGDPVGVVTEQARDREADLIVMTTHGRPAVVNVLLGRTTQRIVQHAPCPVLTVRP